MGNVESVILRIPRAVVLSITDDPCLDIYTRRGNREPEQEGNNVIIIEAKRICWIPLTSKRARQKKNISLKRLSGGSRGGRRRRRRRRVFRDRFHDLISVEPEGSAAELRLRRFPLLHRAISSPGAFALPISASSPLYARPSRVSSSKTSLIFRRKNSPGLPVFGYLPGEGGSRDSRDGAQRRERIKT